MACKSFALHFLALDCLCNIALPERHDQNQPISIDAHVEVGNTGGSTKEEPSQYLSPAAPPADQQKEQAGDDLTTGTLQNIMKTKHLTVCTPGDYPPFIYLKDEQEHQLFPSGCVRSCVTDTVDLFAGFDADFVRRLANLLKANVTYKRVADMWDSAGEQSSLSGRHCDLLVGGIVPKPMRVAKGFMFTHGYFQLQATAIFKCGHNGWKHNETTHEDIDTSNTTIVFNTGGHSDKVQSQTFKNVKKIKVLQGQQLDVLMKGEADAIITDTAESMVFKRVHPGKICTTVDFGPKVEKAFGVPDDVLWWHFMLTLEAEEIDEGKLGEANLREQYLKVKQHD